MNTTLHLPGWSRTLACGALLLGQLAFTPIDAAAAARISEPDTVLYGRVVQRLAGREFQLIEGELACVLKTGGAAGREYRFTTRLRPLGGGTYSYQLRIPHEVLAYDLAVSDAKMPLTAASTAVQRLSLALDGQPLSASATAVDGFSLSQQTRAAARRVDLELAVQGADSDADGLPDWWEDSHGFDKWDPADASEAFPPAVVPPPPPSAREARTFAEWRASLFPGDSRSLDTFGADDADGDGISNLHEYAFDLDPLHADASALAALPRIITVDGRVGLAFRRRPLASDLTFTVEASEDLLGWRNGTAETETVATPAGETQVLAGPSTEPGQKFLRLRIDRH